MKTQSNCRWLKGRVVGVTLVAAAFTLGAAGSARAVTFEQKWHAGEQLSYGLNMTGTLSLNTEVTAPVLWAGIPLDVEVVGTGDVALETKSVKPDGSGIVAIKVPNLTFSGSAFEQKVVMDLKDGKPAFSFNGKPTKVTERDAAFLVQPTYGLQISPSGRVQNVVALDAKPGADGAPGADVKIDGLPVNMQGLLRAAIFQVMPAPWPAEDVAVGDTWVVPSNLPIPAAAGSASPVQIMELGKFNMTLKGEEQLGARKVLRVNVDGAMTIDKAKAAILNAAAGAAAADKIGGNKITSANQKVTGDLWFDAEAGQLVKADLILRSQFKGIFDSSVMNFGKAAPNPATVKTAPFSSTQSFYGSVKLALRDTPKTAATPAAAVIVP